jgi:hypothetical protein
MAEIFQSIEPTWFIVHAWERYVCFTLFSACSVAHFSEIDSVINLCFTFPNEQILLHQIFEIFKSSFKGGYVDEECIKFFLNAELVRKVVEGLSNNRENAVLTRYLFNIIECVRDSDSEVVSMRLKENQMWVTFWKIMDKYSNSSMSKKEKKNPTTKFDDDAYRELRALLNVGKGEDNYKSGRRPGFTPLLIYSENFWINPHRISVGDQLCQILDRNCEFIFSRSNSSQAFDAIATFFNQYRVDKRNVEFEAIIFAEIFQKFLVCDSWRYSK